MNLLSKLNKVVKLHFNDNTLEKRYQKNYLLEHIAQNVLAAKLTILIYIVYAPLAYLLILDEASLLLYVVLFTMSTPLYLIYYKNSKFFLKHQNFMLYFSAVIAGLGPFIFYVFTHNDRDIFQVYLLIPIISIFTMYGVGFILALLSILTIFGIFILLALFWNVPIFDIFMAIYTMGIGGIIAAIAGYLIESSKRKLFLSKLESDEFKYLIDNSHEFIAIYEIKTHKYLYVNKAILKRCNCTKELILKKTISDIHPELTKDIVISMFENLEHNDKIEDVISLKDGDGKEYYSHTILQYGYFKSKKVVIDFSNDVTEQKNAELKIEEMAIRDSLTQLYNRYKFDEYILLQIDDYNGKKKSFSFVICDIDFFKKINDTYGHQVGDVVLKNIANVIQKSVRKSDIVARWGGEEFAVLLPDTSLDEAKKITAKIHKAVSTYVHEEVGNVYISCGVSTFSEGDTVSSIFNRVDTALYEAKNSGRNKICVK